MIVIVMVSFIQTTLPVVVGVLVISSRAELEFKAKPMFGGEYNVIGAKIRHEKVITTTHTHTITNSHYPNRIPSSLSLADGMEESRSPRCCDTNP